MNGNSDPIEEQRQIIEMIYHECLKIAPHDYLNAICTFEYNHGFEDGSSSISNQVTFTTKDGTKYGVVRSKEVRNQILELHKKMKAHTGGDWYAFTIEFAKNGKVSARFQYPETG